MVKDIAPGSADCFINYEFEKLNVNGTLFFDATSTEENVVWKFDGTETGTEMVKDLYPGSTGSNPKNFTSLDGELFFTHAYNGLDQELWKSDGTESGTVIVKAFGSGYDQGLIGLIRAAGGRIFLNAEDGIHGFELWMSDGTNCNTVLAADINPGSGYGSPTGFINTPDGIYFSAFTPAYGTEWGQYTMGDFPEPLTAYLSGTSLCPGDAIDIAFNFNCTALPGNVYTAELSDASGSFSTPVVIGSLNSTDASGIILYHSQPNTLWNSLSHSGNCIGSLHDRKRQWNRSYHYLPDSRWFVFVQYHKHQCKAFLERSFVCE